MIGAGQAGLATGYHLQRAGRSFVILDGNARVGDNWRQRYDSLRSSPPRTGARSRDSPSRRGTRACPTKDEFADYLEAYVARFQLPVRTGVRVDGVRREGDRYVVTAGELTFQATDVVVASGAHRDPRVPVFAGDLDPSIVQLHSSEYRNPSQLREGRVLVVGVGNSGGDIALEVAASHPTTQSGRLRVGTSRPQSTRGSRATSLFRVIRLLGVHVFTLRNPIGRRAIAKMMREGRPVVAA